MHTIRTPRLVMLGAAPETRGSIAAVVEAYRENGLFKRWAIDYIPTYCGGSALDNARMTLKALRRFTRALAEHRRLVLHVHSSPQAGFWRDCLFMAPAFAAGCPVILQLHGGGFQGFHDESSMPLRSVLRYFLERAACVMVPAQSVRSWVRSLARNAHAVCIPNPVSVHASAAEANRPNLILFLGRLEQRKGVFDLLQAVSRLRAAIPDVRLVCAGEGDRNAVARHAARLGIADAVHFTGWVGPSGKRALLENAAVFALPSYAEGLPMSLLEAMAAGVPVIASPVGGIPEVLVDGVSGCLVPPGDVATLERTLRKLLLDRKLAAKLAVSGRESVQRRFGAERAIRQLEDVYAAAGVVEEIKPEVPQADWKKAA
jgi:glycosyltransferase involved in cell wall biosynthesis